MGTRSGAAIRPAISQELYDLVRDPLWYKGIKRVAQGRILGSVAASFVFGKYSLTDAAYSARDGLYTAFEQLLDEGAVALGTPKDGLYEWDSEREAIDSVVFHHTSRAEGISLPRLNAMELLRLYVPVYLNPSPADARRISGKPIYAGHRSGHRQVFYPYHWIIRQDGTSERLLQDYQIGWHCGNWEVNKRSIAICFDDDLSHKAPNSEMLLEAARILTDEYRHTATLEFRSDTIYGHDEFFDTVCPGDQFTAGANWKKLLLDMI